MVVSVVDMIERPLDVTLSSTYFALFSLALLGVLVWQLASHAINARWSEAAIPLAFAFVIALIPGAIALGLWVLDSAARVIAIVFAALHALTCVALLSNPGHSHVLPAMRLLLDAAVVVCLCRPAVRQAFKWQTIEVSLRRPTRK